MSKLGRPKGSGSYPVRLDLRVSEEMSAALDLAAGDRTEGTTKGEVARLYILAGLRADGYLPPGSGSDPPKGRRKS